MKWFSKWWHGPEPEEELADEQNGGPLPSDQGDWVVMPYRIAEACRISLMTVGSHPDIPAEVKLWIAQWLHSYNNALSMYFQHNYGNDIFPVLNQITANVRNLSEKHYQEDSERMMQEAFDKWEADFRGGGDHGRGESSPPAAPAG